MGSAPQTETYEVAYLVLSGTTTAVRCPDI